MLGSFVACLAFSFYFRIHPVVDAQAYDTIAMNIVQGFGFREDPSKDIVFDPAIIRAGPGYEFFLAGLYSIFGHHYEVVWVVQALLHVVSVWLVYSIARRLFVATDEKPALVAAFLFAFWPDLIEISAMLMTETLYLFFILLVLYLFVRAYEQPENKVLASILGTITGVAVLTRPTLLFFVPIFLFFYGIRRQFVAIGCMLLGLIVTLAPWAIRNYLVYHQFILTTLIGEYNLWIGNRLGADGGQIASGFNPFTTLADSEGMVTAAAEASKQFKEFVWLHPFMFIQLCALRFIRYFSLIRPMGFWFYASGLKQTLIVGSSLVWIATVFLSGYAGMVRAAVERNPLWRYLVALAITAPLPLLLTVVQSRYRFQMYPFLVLFAGYAVSLWLEKGNRVWKEKAVWIPVGVLLLITFVDLASNFTIVYERLQPLLFL